MQPVGFVPVALMEAMRMQASVKTSTSLTRSYRTANRDLTAPRYLPSTYRSAHMLGTGNICLMAYGRQSAGRSLRI
jgi:hypothetical protein